MLNSRGPEAADLAPAFAEERQRPDDEASAPTLRAVPTLSARTLILVPRILSSAMTAMMSTATIFRPGLAHRDEGLQVRGRRDGQRRHRSRADAEEDHPAVEEGEQGPERVADVEVEPARVRLHRAELAVGERAQQREEAAEEPGQHREADRAAGLREHAARHQEDAGADDAAHDEEGDVVTA